jgi:glycosyltransferase involved in cell wall biosynthesis
MKKVLIFSLVYYPKFIGGAEVTIKEVTDRIPHSEMTFDMVTLRIDKKLPKYEKVGNVNVYRIGWVYNQKQSSDSLPWYMHLNKYAFLIFGTAKALSLHAKNQYDSIWSLMATYNTFAAIFFKLIHPKVRFIFTLQDGDPISYIKKRALPLYPFFKMFFTKADHIQAISKYLANWAVEMNAKCPITVVPNAVDYKLFSQDFSEIELDEVKREIGKKPNDIFLITTSRLVLKNAVSDIIKSLVYLPSNFKLLICGQGYEEERLRDLVKIENLQDRVVFKGYVGHKDMPRYLKACDIFVRPSLSEGLGNSFLEAMASDIPIIGTNVGGIPDFLIDRKTGLFCEVKNPKSIAKCVKILSEDIELRNQIIIEANTLVKDKYNWENISQQMSKILV